MKLALTLTAAFALHAAAAAGVVVLGALRGPEQPGRASVETIIEVDDVSTPVVHENVAPVAHPAPLAQPSRGVQAPHLVARAAPPATAGDVVAAPAPTLAPTGHFAMTMAAFGGTSTVTAATSPADPIESESDVNVRAAKIAGSAPAYPSEAAADGVELDAPLAFEIVVDATGRVVSVQPRGHAGHGFDEAAMAALRTYRFSPAQRGGHAVAVRMRWTVDFRLN